MVEICIFSEVKERKGTPIAYYFQKIRDITLGKGYLSFLSMGAKELYAQRVREQYDILFDRVMCSTISPFLKQEVEQWFLQRRPLFGSAETRFVNQELEDILERFELL